MIRMVIFSSLLVCFYWNSPVYADPVRPIIAGKDGPTTTLSPAQIELLVTQLGDKQYKVRQNARNSLEQLGPIALPYLQAALNREKNPEVIRQLNSLIPGLEQQAALAPTVLTLTCKDMPLAEVIKEVEKQSKYKIELMGAKHEKATVSLQWDKVNFWQGLHALCDQQGLIFQEGWYGNDNVTVRLVPGESNNGFRFLDGPFRVTVTGFHYNRSLQFNMQGGQGGSSSSNETLQANLTVTVEPKMPLLSVKQPIFTEAMSDNNENLLLPINPQRAQYYQHGYRSYMHQVNAQLKPSSAARRMKTLKGTIPVTVVAQTKPVISVEKLSEAKGKTFKQGTSTLRIDDITSERGQNGIKMSLTEGSANNPNDYSWMNSIQQRIEVFDDKGNKLQNYGGSWGMNGNNNINGTFNFSGVPAKLIYYEWITMNYQIPFMFEDLPLP